MNVQMFYSSFQIGRQKKKKHVKITRKCNTIRVETTAYNGNCGPTQPEPR